MLYIILALLTLIIILLCVLPAPRHEHSSSPDQVKYTCQGKVINGCLNKKG